ncbi:hypothetical protein QCA50_010204 [Cerrena zonata]|uniref:Cleavage stimulation factor subunit 2 hinge domain-containing protein n=1 Tax=Cerrena zonata TaxID=2478898 RepID=A0AAW0G8N9_9APHY
MSVPVVQENQLLELLLQLKRTTPEQARAILNAQPQIAYALIAMMVNINAIDVEVVQRTLSSYGAAPAVAAPVASTSQIPVAPAAAIPPHLANHGSRGGTPPFPPHNNTPPRQSTPTYPNYPQQGYPQAPQNHFGGPPTGPSQPVYGAPIPNRSASYGNIPSAPPAAPPAWQAALALIPEDQRPLLTRVANMTPQEIHTLPPNERKQLHTTACYVGYSYLMPIL